MLKRIIALCVLVSICLPGCGGSARVAQQSLDKGMAANTNVRNALFAKGWILNRALITESRNNLVARTQLAIVKESVKNARAGKDIDSLSPEQMCTVVEMLGKEIGLDEVTTSENFAQLSLLLLMGERADAYLDNVDTFIESKKPIYEHILKSGRTEIKAAQNEFKAWEPLIRDFKPMMKDMGQLQEIKK